MSSRVQAFVLILLAGCNSFALGAADRTSLRAATLVEACPLGVPWSRVEMAETADGALVHFVTSLPSNVPELRQRARDQARAYGPDRHRGIGHDGDHGGPRDHGLRLWTMGEIRVDVADTANGATLHVAPADPARLAELREHVARRVAQLNAADCPN